MASGDFVWYDLLSPDVEASRAFYSALFGWDIHDSEQMPGYPMLHVDGAAMGGIEHRAGEPSRWLSYVAVADLAASVAQAIALGGTAGPAQPIPGVGTFAVVTDRQGAALALLQLDDPSMQGWTAPKGAGALSWAELQTSDDVDGRDFWTALLGWPHQAWPMGEDRTYWLVGNGHNAGIMKATAPGPAHWMLYANVDDADAVARRAPELGGRVLAGPMAMGDIGRFVIVCDPVGAVVAAMQSARRD